METANEKESGQEGGAEEKPSPQSSPNADSKTSPVDVEALAKALLPTIEDAVERKTQSTKDKRIQSLENQVDSFESKLADFNEWKKAGLTDDDALWRMKVESQLKMNEAPPVEQVGAPIPVASVEIQAILKALGLAENNPEVTKVLRDTKDVAAQMTAFVNLSKTQPPAEPNPAAVQPSGGGQTANQSAEAIADQLVEAQKQPLANRELIQTLTAALDEVVTKQ